MANKEDSEVVKIQGRLTVTQGLWDYERTQILKALGIAGDINVRSWTTETLVKRSRIASRARNCSPATVSKSPVNESTMFCSWRPTTRS